MYKVKVYVTLRESVLDPQGTAVKNSLHSMNYREVTDVRIGKYMELIIEKSDRDIEELFMSYVHVSLLILLLKITDMKLRRVLHSEICRNRISWF